MLKALLDKMFSGSKKSKSLAKSRLHFVLVQDRTGLTSDMMGQFKKELISVIEKYFVIDKNGFDIAYQRDSQETTLLINSPVVVRRQEGESYGVGARKKHVVDNETDKESAPTDEAAEG